MPMIGEGLQQPAAHACVPLAFNGPSRGVLNVAALPGTTFDAAELRFLETVGRNRVQYRPTSLDALVDEVVLLLRPEARAASVTLRRERSGEPTPDVRVDPEKMKQVVINLVQNAIEAIPDGGSVESRAGSWTAARSWW